MALYGLLPALQQSTTFRDLVEKIKAGPAADSSLNTRDLAASDSRLTTRDLGITAGGVPAAAVPYLLGALQVALKRTIVVVLPEADRARSACEELMQWSLEPASVMLFPELEGSPYDEGSARPETVRQRAAVLAELKARPHHEGRWFKPIVVTSAQALLPRVTPPEQFAAQVFTLTQGQTIAPDALLQEWYRMGFEAVAVVEDPGSFTRRGGIVDVFPPAHAKPVRLEFWGDDIESIRLFDPQTQLSESQLKTVTFTPAREAPASAAARAQELLERLDFSVCREEEAGRWKRALEAMALGEKAEDLDFYLRFLFERPASLLDYLPEDGLVVWSEQSAIIRQVANLVNQAEETRAELVREGDLPDPLPRPYLTWAEIVREQQESAECRAPSAEPSIEPGVPDTYPGSATPNETTEHRTEKATQRSALSTWHSALNLTAASTPDLDLGFRVAASYAGKLKSLAADLKKWTGEGLRVVLLSLQSLRLSEQLAGEKLIAPPREDLTELPEEGSLTLLTGALKEGWRNSDIKLALLTDVEMFGWSKPRRLLAAKSNVPPLVLSDIAPGDFVVHVEHGVARYAGLVRRELEGVGREYLVLQYAGTDQLFVPVEQIDRISRYIGVGEAKPTLNRLGTADWDKAKTRVKQSIVHLAAQLLALYSQRELTPGYAYSPDSLWQDELESRFPYVETPDQLQAASEIKQDMEQPRPMDRLLCGDVGFGKTEVAVRAAFKAVMDGRQAAVLVPTTVLAEQHLNTFSERMKPFPVKVEMLSRFRSAKDQKRIIAELKLGSVDVLIGTHRMLQRDVQFKNLGLLIIDEEQRFGVMHKERLKELRKDVDVLTMTATPIPRTLNMAMVGVRDMSVIETPPEYRHPIKTYLEPYRDDVVRDAILREIQRGGQVYYVHNRVETMAPAIQKLRKLVPEASFVAAHGQMDEGQLEKVMYQFERGEFDVLVCSTIIENGLDIPNVNTIIINDAGKLGLAQLYQLRGRVGRSATQAYAYLLFKEDVPLTDQAEKRLRTIFETTDLGAGYKIAMKDLEIRGAGNLLGPEQHGQMNAVGFDLYCKLLAESIQEMKGEEIPDPTRKDTVTVDIGLDALIPDDYVTDLAQKMNLYQRLALVTKLEQSAALLKEIRDRFGPLPDAVVNLFFLLDLKLRALEAGVQVIKKSPASRVLGPESKPQEEILLVLKDGTASDRQALSRRFGQALQIGTQQLRLRTSGEEWRRQLPELLDALRETRPEARLASPLAAASRA